MLSGIATLKLAISGADSFRIYELQKIIQERELKENLWLKDPVRYKPGNAIKNHIIPSETELDEYLKKLKGEMLKI